jgi:hypothetical protein
MRVLLPLDTFSFFKFIISFFILLFALLFPVVGIITLVILIVGRAHTLGAWMAMWRAGKLTWEYLFWVVVIMAAFSYWGFAVASLEVFGFVAYALFAIHFMFDEFDLQEEKRTHGNILSSLTPFFLTIILLISQFTSTVVPMVILVSIAFAAAVIELLFVKEINWFFFHTKVLTIFILGAASASLSAAFILNVFLLSHYLFWFIYPVYKLHKYKREERDSFIMMLLIIVGLSIFIYSSKIWGGEENIELTQRSFYLASIVHVLLTAPFGYLFGLPRPIKST